MEISLGTIVRVFKKSIVLMIILALVAGIGAYMVSAYVIEPTYESTAKINVVTNKEATNTSEANTGATYITKIIKTCTELLESEDYIQAVKISANLDEKPTIKFTSTDDATVIIIKASHKEPQKACDIALVAAQNSVEYIEEMTSKMATVKIYETPKVALKPSSPNSVENAAIAAIAIAVIVYFISFLIEITGTKVKSENELIERFGNIPVIATIPDFNESMKRSNKSDYYKKYYAYASGYNSEQVKGKEVQ